MPTPAELAVSHTELEPEALEHLQRLLGSWSVLADLSFSDLLLLVPVAGLLARGATEDPELVVMGQMRPNNRPTLVEQDLVGQTVNESQWDLVAKCLHTGEIVRGNIHHPIIGERVPVENIPVRFEGAVIAVMLRVSLAPLKGPTSTYERTYLDVFERLADMVAQSAFPFPDEDVGTEEAPRVGDGVVVVDADGRVEFASPNAMNAFHRMGIYSPPEGRRFGDLDIDESAVEWALTAARPVVEEVERRPDVIVLVHCIPLLSHDVVTGAMILLRDVTDVRRLDRLLLSKDAAIREVHHRVKNNLQTISSLLSLQARRVDDRAARIALHEAERRVRSIALVHEILSRDPTDQVPFAEIVVSLVQMAEDSVVSAQPIVISTSGDLGDVTADVATPLAVTVAELLQNAVEHGFEPDPADDGPTAPTGPVPPGRSLGSGGSRGGDAWPMTGTELTVAVQDDGVGLPEGFDIEQTTSLGLSIVRDLVESQLEGDIGMVSLPESEGGGTRVRDLGPGACPPPSSHRAIERGTPRRLSRGACSERGDRLRRRDDRVRRCVVNGEPPATPCATCGAPPRTCHPRRRTPDWWRGRNRGTARAPRRNGTRAWRRRSGRRLDRSCRPGRTGPVRCCDMLRRGASRLHPSRPSGST